MSTNPEIVIPPGQAIEVREHNAYFAFKPITKVSSATQGSTGAARTKEIALNSHYLSPQDIETQVRLAMKHLDCDDSDMDTRADGSRSTAHTRYPSLEAKMTRTVKRYLGCETEKTGEEDVEMTDVLAADVPAITKSRAPFNSKPWHIDLTGTGYSSNSFAAADRSVESVLDPARAAKLANADLGPNHRDEGCLTLVSLPISLPDDAITLSGRVSLGNRNTTRPLNGQELEALRPEVESYLNGLDTASHEFKSLRYDQEKVPHTVNTALLEIGKAYIQANFDCDHFRNRSLTTNPHINLSAPLILNGTGTEGVYDRAIFMAERQIESLIANKFGAETNPTKKQAFTTIRDATIDQLQAKRPSRVSDEQWSIFSNEVMNHLISEVYVYDLEELGLGDVYSLDPMISTWDCSAAGERSDDPDWPHAKAASASPDDATHFHVTLARTNKDASDTTRFADSYRGDARNFDFFDIPKSAASTE